LQKVWHEYHARIKIGFVHLHRQDGHPRFCFRSKKDPIGAGSLRQRLGSVAQRMLTRTLRSLESAGLIARRVTKSRAIAVEYSLPQLGRTIIAPLGGMCRWAKRYRTNVSAEVRLRETETG
jgi:DNA-binding HxlR family transcriptional regulator